MAPQSASRRARWLVTAAAVAAIVAGGCGGSGPRATTFDSVPPATVSAPSSAGAAATPSTPSRPARFETLPVGSALPTDQQCADWVRPVAEVRPSNERFNQTRGHPTAADPGYPLYARVTGDYTGTTDEILQWAACKWGIDEDVVRAQAAKETYWTQDHLGDFGTDPSRCVPGHPIGADGESGKCPESIGLLQTRYPYFMATITDAMRSTAYEADITYAVWRTCFEGGEQWLNTAERGQDYAAGDLWGCVGAWFAGRWYTPPAKDYIAAVQDYVDKKIWQTDDFVNYSG
jgi:hypothetical protein